MQPFPETSPCTQSNGRQCSCQTLEAEWPLTASWSVTFSTSLSSLTLYLPVESIDEVYLLANPMSEGVVVIQTTLPGEWEEFRIGSYCQNLIENGAKCVEYSEIRSMYVWGGELQSEKEWRVEVKSSESKKVEITEFLEKNHPYEIPQILVKAVGSTETYSRWIHSQEEPSK